MPSYYSAVPRHSYTMPSFFPHVDIASELAPFLRLLDEATSGPAPSAAPLRTFQPRFDVREERDGFHLTGELPGIAQENIQIEFVDQNTLTIRGRAVREESRGAAPSTAIEEKKDDTADTTDDIVVVDSPASPSSSSSYHKATVEEEEDASAPAATSSSATAEVATPAPAEQPKKPEEPGSKYWVSERHVGQFHRTFTFPGQVDQDAVTASLRDGILSVVVPKAVRRQPRRIAVQ